MQIELRFYYRTKHLLRMSKLLSAVILGSILLVGVGFGSISLMQKSNAQNMTSMQQPQAIQQLPVVT
jgi:hypothetical protein